MNKKNWRLWATILATVLAIVFVYWQREAILRSIEVIKNSDPKWLAASVIAHISSVVAAAAVYWQVAIKKTNYFNLFIAQTASLFTSRVTPASVGGIATMGKVLANSGHSMAQLSAVISANAIVTFLGNFSIMVLALLISQRDIVDSFKIPKIIFLLPLFILIGLIVIYSVKPWRAKAISFIKDLAHTLKMYRQKKLGLLFGFIFGMMTTLGYMIALWAAGQAVGVELSFLAVIVTVSLGTLGASATPLPGGVVGAEATLALSMTQFGVPPAQALAVAFTYRFITYWLPILPGYLVTQFALKRKIL